MSNSDNATNQDNTKNISSKKEGKADTKVNKKALYILFGIIAAIILGVLLFVWYSPSSITYAKITHYHLRFQLIVDGKAENFSDAKYQIPYFKGQCTGEMSAEPFHFHDDRDQLLHVHWNNMTGGQMLKYYGWNKIGGVNNSMGFRLDKFQNIPIHGLSLPSVPEGSNYYVYIGDENNYQAKNLNDFVNQDFETFFGKQSIFNQEQSEAAKNQRSSFVESLFTKVSAHGSKNSSLAQSSGSNPEKPTQADLERINDLLGNVVIFVQKQEPSKEEIQERFKNLVELEASTCGG